MEILQPSWRGRDIQTRKDGGGKYTAMIGPKSMLYIPVNVLPKAVYNLTIELCRESGNGIVRCNIYGNKNFDFAASEITCDRGEWSTYSIDVVTGRFPPTVPMTFRVWRGSKGTGTMLIRKVKVELVKGEKVKPQTTAKLVSTDSVAPPPPPPKRVNPKKPRSKRVRDRKARPPRNPKRRKSKSKLPIPPVGLVVSKNHKVNEGGKKVLYLPANNISIFQTGMENAFIKNGFDLYTFDFRNFFARHGAAQTSETLKNICHTFGPDWIHMQLQFTGMIPASVINDIRRVLPDVIITNWTGDVRATVNPYFIDIGKQVDFSLLSSEGQVKLYRNAGCPNVDYWQIGVNTEKFLPLSKEKRASLRAKYDHDVVFCALCSSHFPDSNLRKKIVCELYNTFGNRFALYGSGWKRTNSCRGAIGYYTQNEVYNAAEVAINVNHFNNIPMYFSDRQLITMASGTPVVCHYIPGLEKYFENGKDVAWFKDLSECKRLVGHYLNNPVEAAEMGKRGAAKVIEQHSDYRRVKELAIRIGMVEEASDEEIAEHRLLRTKERKYRVMGIVEESTDRRYEHRISFANVDFQGIFCNSHVVKRVAEYQPDLLYVDSALVKRLHDRLVTLRRRMPDMVFTCFSDALGKAALDKFGLFDYIIVRKPQPEMEDDVRVVRLYADKFLEKKDRRDIIEEVQLVIEKANAG